MAPVSQRTHPVSRLEGFSDAVFGFALTLLVVQLEVPRSSEALLLLVRGSVPFALTFAMVCYIWWEHNRFFRQFGLQDAWTAFLNCALLFVVLFYVYPLKFLTTTLLAPVVGLPAGGGLDDGRFVMLVYSSGVLAIFGVFVLLYRHVIPNGPEERLFVRYKTRAHAISASLALLSVLLAATLPDPWIWIAGVLYSLMAPLHGWNGYAGGQSPGPAPSGRLMNYRAPMKVRFSDIDRAGIVYYPRFFHYFHVAMEEFFGEALGRDYAKVLETERFGLPTVHLETDFRRPLRYGDHIEVEVAVESVGNTSVTWRYTVYRRGEPEPVAECTSVTVCLNLDRYEKRGLPDWLRTALEERVAPGRAGR